ncbi:cytochrome P450-dit2, partial [Mortierella sp. NVP85]
MAVSADALAPLYQHLVPLVTRPNGLKLLAAAVALYVFNHRSHAVGTRRRRDLKQPKGAVPLLGHMPVMAAVGGQNLYQFLEKQYNELGPVWSISLPLLGRIIYIDTPENLEHVLKTNFWSYEKGPTVAWILKDLVGD